MELEPCFYCGEDIDPDSDYVSEVGYHLHSECHQKFENENIQAEKRERARHLNENNRNERIKRHLKRTLKPKIWDCISVELSENGGHCGHLAIVTLDKVTGTKQSGYEYFGESVAVRHVYDNTSSCSYSDTFGGEINIYIGKGRYLQMHIWG
ncbi:hypothetical protein LMH73_027775 [Vibrio splendidus]|nr:hypothetical protein [Vibrio splendidus]MCC4882522.1 hypothetical protein [Vibrio splendidus]